MAKGVPVQVKLSENAVDTAILRKSLEMLHIHVIIKVIEGENYSDQQIKAVSKHMQEKISGMTRGKFDA